MEKGKMRLAAVICCAALLLCAAVPAPVWASGTEITFDGVLYRLTVENPEGLLGDAGPLLPGDSAEATVFLRNEGDSALRFYLSLAPAGAEAFEDGDGYERSLALLAELELEVALRAVDAQGNIGAAAGTVYHGPADGGAWDGYVPLATYEPGGWGVLQVTLRVPTSLGNEFQAALGALDWRFLCSYDDDGGGGSESSGGGGNGGTGGGGGSGGGNGGQAGGTGAGGGFTVIEDGEVPLGGIVEIVDDEVPLGNLPKTGGGALRAAPVWLGPAGVLVLAALTLVWRGKRKRVAR